MGLFHKKDEALEEKRKAAYERIYQLHENSDFLCYVNEAYQEKYEGRMYVKLEGTVAKGVGLVTDSYELYSCTGKKKADITMDELYVKTDKVDQLQGGDKVVALYPKQQDVRYVAGDIVCIRRKENASNNK